MGATLLGFENAHDEAIDVIPTIKAVICFPIVIIVATRSFVRGSGANDFVGPSHQVKKQKEGSSALLSEFATTEMLADDAYYRNIQQVETYSHTP
jgi:hypothetical protein